MTDSTERDTAMIVVTEYRKTGYTIADAFKTNPMAGRRIFYVDTAKLGTDDMKVIVHAAKDTAPQGYELHKCEPS